MTATDGGAMPLALYVHWPFCVSKCPYCDFNSHVRTAIDPAAWQKALLADLAHEAALTPGRTLGSIFFGGGTPSLMPPHLVAALIDAAMGAWTVAEDLEITLEANPNSAEVARFCDLAAAGVNRLSLGIQSFDAAALRFLGRAHNVEEAARALDAAQSAVDRVSFDLIYALPGQSSADWAAMLAQGLARGTEHLSLYQLTIEPGTRFATDYAAGRLTMPDPDHAADLYELTRDMTAAAGLFAYETSNYARPGAQSRHNLTYWRYGDYVGIGPGAHGRRRSMASERHRKPENYLSAVARNGHGLSAEVTLDRATRATEALLMGLRLTEGVDLAAIAARTGVPQADLLDDRAVSRLAAQGLIAQTGNRLHVLPAGQLVLDGILADIVAPDLVAT